MSSQHPENNSLEGTSSWGQEGPRTSAWTSFRAAGVPRAGWRDQLRGALLESLLGAGTGRRLHCLHVAWLVFPPGSAFLAPFLPKGG